MKSMYKRGNQIVFFIALMMIFTYFQVSIVGDEQHRVENNTILHKKYPAQLNNQYHNEKFKMDAEATDSIKPSTNIDPIIIRENINTIPILSTELTYQNDVGDDFLPTLIEFNGKLYAIWYTNDPQISEGNDFDIVYRTYDGHFWSEINEISNNDENDSILLRCGETSGQAIVYKDQLYFIWHIYPDGRLFPYKIMIKSFDGKKWDEIKEISLSENYWFYGWPAAAVYDDKLYITWDAGDKDSSDHADLLMSYYDGEYWSEPIDIVTTYDTPHGPAFMEVFNDRLYLAWLHDSNLPYDQYIKIKYGDGINWSDEIIVNPYGDACLLSDVEIFNDELYITWVTFTKTLTENLHRCYKIRGFDGNNFGEIYMIDFQEDNKIACYDNKLFSIGTTWDPKYTSGTDVDIVMVSFNGSSWSNMREISFIHDEPTSPEGYDNNPFIYVFNNTLYAIWQTISAITSSGNDLDIIIKDVSSF